MHLVKVALISGFAFASSYAHASAKYAFSTGWTGSSGINRGEAMFKRYKPKDYFNLAMTVIEDSVKGHLQLKTGDNLTHYLRLGNGSDAIAEQADHFFLEAAKTVSAGGYLKIELNCASNATSYGNQRYYAITAFFSRSVPTAGCNVENLEIK